VEEPQSGTRVEIELTPNDNSRLRRRKSPAAAADLVAHDHGTEPPVVSPELEAQLPPESGSPPTTIERRKLVVGAAAVAIVALFVGWALGRSGGSSASEDAQPEATTADTSPSETPPLAEIPTTIPVTTRPVVVRAGPTTSTVPEWETSYIDVDRVAADLDIDVVLLGGGRIAEVDTGSGEMRSLKTRATFQQPPIVVAGTDWIVIRDFDSGVSQLVRDGELPVGVSIGDPWSTLFDPATGLFWKAPNSFGMGQPMTVTQVDHEGHETGLSLVLPDGVWPVATDPAGGVIASAPGGTYQIGLDGVRRITSGNLLSLNERIAVMTQCGDDFSTCGVFVVDRASGEQTTVEVVYPEAVDVNGVFDLQNPASWGYPGLMEMISPDDRWTPVLVTNYAQQFGLIDLVTGQLVVLGANPPSALWWSPDGSVALYSDNGRLMLFNTADGSKTNVLPSEGGGEAFAVRPSA